MKKNKIWLFAILLILLISICCVFIIAPWKPDVVTSVDPKFDRVVKSLTNKYNVKFIKDTDDSKLFGDENEEGSSGKKDDLVAANFHIWSWQKYLHLTQKVNEQNKHERLPFFLRNKDYYQVSDKGVKVSVNPKKYDLKLDSIIQAGPAHPVLECVNGDTIYYSIHMNEKMYSSMQAGLKHTMAKFKFKDSVECNRFIDSVFPQLDLSNNLKYKVGSIELKAAWKLLPIGSVGESNKIVVNSQVTGRNEKRFAQLVGLHIVGKVNGFDELLWSTFEASDLAPDNLLNLTDPSTQSKGEEGFIVAKSDKDMLYYRKGVTEFHSASNVIKYDSVRANPKYKSQVYRKYPLGIDIRYLRYNEFKKHYSYIVQLKRLYEKNRDKLDLYYNGSIWLNKKKIPNTVDDLFKDFDSDDITKLAGSPNCTNISLETFYQNTNCFSCHGAKNTFKYPKTKVDSLNITDKSLLNFSHVYTRMIKDSVLQRFKISSKNGELFKNAEERKAYVDLQILIEERNNPKLR